MNMIEETKSLQDGKMEIKRDMSFLMKLYSILEVKSRTILLIGVGKENT
jgi:hypothetical protein